MAAADLLDRRALNRALLARQGLLDRRATSVLDVVEHLGGLQSQATVPPYLALTSRVAGFEPALLSDLLEGRQLVRTSTLRSTIHLVSVRDAAVHRALLQARTERAFLATYARRLAGADLDQVTARCRMLVEEEPRTFAELGRALAPLWPDADPAALAQVARARLPLVQVTPRGLWGRSGSARHTTLQAWTGIEAVDLTDPERAVQDLVLGYLAAFGPATARDAQTWSGLTGLGHVLDRLRPRLATFVDDRGAELFDLPDAPRPDPATPAPVRLVAPFDNLVLSHVDRSRVLGDVPGSRLFSVNGLIPGTVLVDGFVAGTWRLSGAVPPSSPDRSGGSWTIEVEPMSGWPAAVTDAVHEQAVGVLRSIGADAMDVRVSAAG